MARVLVAALLVLGLAGCGASSVAPAAKTPPLLGTAAPLPVTIAGQPAQVWPASGASRAVIYLHGRDQDEQILGGPQSAILASLHTAGWTIGTDYAHGNAWGDEKSVADYRSLIHYLRITDGARTIVLLGASMGGLATLHLLRAGDAATAVLVSPVTNLASMYKIPDAVPELTPIYGSSAPSADDPQTWSPDALHGDTVTVIADPADPIVPFATNAKAFAQRFGLQLVHCSGGHAVPACFAKVSFG